jgi:TonB-dependent receptor
VRAGLRREETGTDSTEFDPRTTEELRAAGFNVTAGRATTIPGLQYQYFSKPRVHRTGNYDNLFPSASLKYRIAPSLDAQFGFSTTIRRPTFRDLAGVWTVNDDAMTVTAPNPQLTPETSRNYSARLAYYFEPVGIFAVNAFQNSVKGLFSNDRLTAAEFGYDGDLDLAGYEFITTSQSANRVLVRGMEYEYSQSLSFLPEPFKGLNVRASYTRNYAEIKKTNMIPHSINAGLSYAFRRVSAYANLNWRDNYPTTVTGNPRFYRHRSNLDIGGSYRFNARYSFFFSARNIFNAPYIVMEQVGLNPAAAQFYQVIGTNWTFGFKGVW